MKLLRIKFGTVQLGVGYWSQGTTTYYKENLVPISAFSCDLHFSFRLLNLLFAHLSGVAISASVPFATYAHFSHTDPDDDFPNLEPAEAKPLITDGLHDDHGHDRGHIALGAVRAQHGGGDWTREISGCIRQPPRCRQETTGTSHWWASSPFFILFTPMHNLFHFHQVKVRIADLDVT